ncbi:MAG: hypothetical protein KGZ40_02120 [Clostridiales bacterium]|nr:hypothetical protein [Clostridiales bacterium]
MHQARILLDLQEHDLEIRRDEKRLDELPEKRAILELRHKAEQVRQLRAKAEGLAHRHELAIAATNDEIALIDAKITGVQAVLDSGGVTNPKEVHNLAREMDALKRRKDKLENDALQTMERHEKALGQAEKIDAALSALSSQESALIDEFRVKGGELQRTLERRRQERDALATVLGAALRERYESVRAAKGGIGAARLDNTMCTACRVDLPRERVHELLGGPDVGVCPTCRRLIVVRGFDDE